ncbi:MAG: 30S ribosomal protein S17 [Dehalococcoidales bacterium]
MEEKSKSRLALVVSDKMEQTVVVAIDSRKRHRVYKKTYKHTTRYKVHNANNEAKMGDTVRIVETRPLSREKRWRVVEVVTKGRVTEPPTVLDEPLEERTEK